MKISPKRSRVLGAPSAPKHLSVEARRLWREITAEYGIGDTGGTAILAAGLEAFDRMRAAQKSIAADGATVRDRFGQLQAHPAVRIERDSRAAWLGSLKQLNLDVEPLQSRVGRPSGR